MPDINITVAHKVAVSDTQFIVCDNSDYTVHWTLDDEWSAYDTKTMRTIYMDGTFTDKVFAGDTIELPVCTVPGAVQIGLFAGDIRTSRVAILRALPSVRSAAGAPADPEPDVYDQLMERMAQLETSDWAQNDPTAKDYVRNRTHYVSRESKALVPEQEVTTAVQDDFNVAILNNVDLDTFKTLYDSDDDTTLDVVFDGASYPCKWLEQDGNRIPVFGNLAIAQEGSTDTGEPFCVTPGPEDALAIGCKVAGTHTVVVSYQQDVVHTLDPKYIKDMYYAESEEQPLVSEVEIDTRWNGDYTGRIQADHPSEGQTIIVTYDGVKYKRKAQSFMGYVVVGNTALSGAGTTATDTGEPFYLRFWERHCGGTMVLMNAILADGTTSHTLSAVTIVEQVHTLPDKYISAEIPRKGDIIAPVQSDWNETRSSSMAYIKHKPNIIKYAGLSEVSSSSKFITWGVSEYVWLVFTTNAGERVPLVQVLYSGKKYDILSSKTGKPMTADECPYGCMALAIQFANRIYCINPL